MSEALTKSPEVLGAEIRNLTAAAKYMTVWYGVEIGRRLTEAKAAVKHGEWLPWLAENTEFSASTASRLMRIFEEYGSGQGQISGDGANCATLQNISVSNALRLLAVPEEERESFAAEVDAEHISSRELEAAIKAREEAEKALKEAQSDLVLERNNNEGAALKLAELTEQRDKIEQKLIEQAKAAQELREQIKELESKPVEVAVQEPDPEEIEKRVAEAVGKQNEASKAEIEKLKAAAEKQTADVEKLKDALAMAKTKLTEAQNAGEKEQEDLRAEVETLRKQLATSGAEMTEFKLRFAGWQEAYAVMMSAMDAVPEEAKAKCAAAVKAVLASWEG